MSHHVKKEKVGIDMNLDGPTKAQFAIILENLFRIEINTSRTHGVLYMMCCSRI